MEYCNQLLKLADFIDPGLSQLRGHLLFELQSAMENKAIRSFKRDSAQFKVSQIFRIVFQELYETIVLMLTRNLLRRQRII